jgi:hypothetical protein
MWTYVYDLTSGKLLSETDGAPGVLPLGASVLTRIDRVDLSSQMWNETLRDFVSRPARALIDRIAEIRSRSEWVAVESKLTPAELLGVRNLLVELLGNSRFRAADSKMTIGAR